MIHCEFEDGAKASLRHVVVHAIVEQEGKILLEKRAQHLTEAGKWCLPGGYVNRNETAQQAVLRELREETGWTGEVMDMLRVNANPERRHEPRQDIGLDFIVKPLEKVGDGDLEVDKMMWFPLDALPSSEDWAFDHKESVQLYLKYRNKIL